ncbi:MAG: Hemolysins and related proteins containing CBS domains [uncultured Gemmatimonadetes bacterium]|uniref:Hemolysins and related proteins containing CBS domains n=1 Tax=uncultured Gemmatimonadota bacterium TaxID=203437 RepID=A0A6J4M295_9BACT|nr:MAG: Hemolysins and related proteins containing CBS domains [uncultured Gemmatimonadota bacterium]
MASEVLIVLALLVLNGVFSMSEIAVVSSRRARLQQRADAGDAGARRALALAEDPSRFLATVQVGITLVGVLTGAFGGAALAKPVAVWLAPLPYVGPYAEGVALGLVVLAITYLSLIVGELVPKEIGLGHPERIASLVARPMHALSRVAAPLVWVLTFSSRMVLRVLRITKNTDAAVTEADVAALLEEATESGVIHESEQDLVERVFWLGDRRVVDLATPRHRVAWVDVADDEVELRAKMISQPRAGYLVCDGGLDRVVGTVEVRDLWEQALRGHVMDLKASLKQPLFVPENTRALHMLELFRDTSSGMAVVVDEYGGVDGVLTRDDLLEDVAWETAPSDPHVVQRDDGSYLMDAGISVDDFREALGLDERRTDERAGYRTVGGLIVTRLGRIPRVGEHVESEGYRIEVVDMDGPRIDKVLVAKTD